mmetsp:Transcript_15603/g.17336  ORF Transcript_15603/g.17336 Transcript_15603/m.17336 type:complete len:211 (+) Transcript_15603:2273-2905(+)|eukprot:CAMPEP_0114973334 /NCGR_PEP_ID=MMETSP0216-20121206/898_1 /TAXON_ID=223996 /ORGANISM="Protocruzia adherens, Strain Boccale" /LENGTH=210 /DNA_ID=CAMNT_0002333817 /DNA_START=2330 /DNA_END=2962 /DNA_ORIENTATION=+
MRPKSRVACNKSQTGEQEDSFNHIYASVDSSLPFYVNEGYHTKDLSQEVKKSNTLVEETSTLSLDLVVQQVDSLSTAALSELPSEESRSVSENLLAALYSGMDKTSSSAEVTTMATAPKSVTKNINHLTASAVTTSISAVQDLIIEADKQTTVTATVPQDIFSSLSSSVEGTTRIHQRESDPRSSKLKQVDDAVTQIGSLVHKDETVGVS